MPGVHIGNGCIIGTNAVLAKNIPDYSIAVGKPRQSSSYDKFFCLLNYNYEQNRKMHD